MIRLLFRAWINESVNKNKEMEYNIAHKSRMGASL
jgi:hypothetical protein